jgi:hypothetical protein
VPSAACHHAVLLPSCSPRNLQSLDDARVPPYWLTVPPWPWALRRAPGLRGLPQGAAPMDMRAYPPASSPGLRSAPGSTTRYGLPRLREATLLGFPAPSTHQATGSDLHRDCRSRLCGVPRLSQPLDALLHPWPLRPCFVPVAPMGFRPSEVSPSRPSPHLSMTLPLVTFRSTRVLPRKP